MSTFGSAASAAFQRAAERARLIIRPDDRITMGDHGSRITVTFVAWVDYRGLPDPKGAMFASKSRDDLSPWNITKVNGQPVSFRDPDGEAAVAADRERFDREREFSRAASIQHRRSSMRIVKDQPHD